MRVALEFGSEMLASWVALKGSIGVWDYTLTLIHPLKGTL